MFSINRPPKYTRKNRRGKSIRKRKPKLLGKAIIGALKESWKDFCTTSSFVGFRYVYRKNRTSMDVLFWFLLMPLLMYCSIVFVGVFLDRYHSMSTTTVIATQQLPSSRSNFPAITTCLTSRFSKSRVNAFVEEYINSNDDLKKSVNLTHFYKIFDLGRNHDFITLSNAGRVFSAHNLTMRDVLELTTEDCEEIFTVCRFAGQITPCSEIFKRTMAVGGFCCSFNYPAKPEQLHRRQYLKVLTFGLKGGLTFAFKIAPNEDYFYKVNYGNTLRVVVHTPRNFPTFNQNDYFMSKSMETALEINSVVNTADKKLKSLRIEERDCVFSIEKELSRFTRYSNSNCLLQCRIDRVLKNCGCVSFFLPSNNSEICSAEKFPCSFISRRVGSIQGDKRVYTQFSDCDCPDDCGVVKQYAKLNSWPLSSAKKYSVDEFYEKVQHDEGIVHIYYGKSTTMRLNRKLSLDEIQLASNIGGIVAIFLGCSFVSVIEIIYFFTIRMLKFYKQNIST